MDPSAIAKAQLVGHIGDGKMKYLH